MYLPYSITNYFNYNLINHRPENQRIIISEILLKEEEAALVNQPQQNESLLGHRNRLATARGEFP